MKFAVIKTGGKQYKVAEGDMVTVERLANPLNEAVSFSDVLLLSDGETVTLGKPVISGMTVTGIVMEHLKGDKIRVAHYKAKARHRRVNGHRQSLTTVRIDAIGGASSKKAAPAKVAEAPVEEDTVSTHTPPEKKPARARANKAE